MCVFSGLIYSVEKLKGVRMSDLPLRFDWVTFPMMVLQSEARHKQNKGYCRGRAWGMGRVCVCACMCPVSCCVTLTMCDRLTVCDIWWLCLLIFSEAQVVRCVPHWRASDMLVTWGQLLLIYLFSTEASCCPLYEYIKLWFRDELG